MKISISGKDKYDSCSEMYRLHYIEKIRPIAQSSALVFGSALDNALNELLEKKISLSGTKELFLNEWDKYETVDNITYFKSDLDETLLTKMDRETFTSDDYHRPNWLSMRAKGLRLIDIYHQEILPRIVNVRTVQKTISIKGSDSSGNETDDEITGIIDLEADIKTDSGQIVHAILDNKSTSTPYPKNSVLTKHQTALYTFATGVKHAGFLTMNKKTFKTQCIIDVVPEELQEQVINEFIDVIDKIKNDQFEKNQKNKCFMFGKRCDYYNLCWNNSMVGLIKKEDKENG